MPTQHTDDDLPYPELGDPDWHVPLLAFLLALAARSPLKSLLVLPAEEPSASLDVRILGGLFRNAAGKIVEVAEQALTLPDDATRRVWLTNSGIPAHGAVWPTATDVVPLARVTTAGGVVTAALDLRSGFGVMQAL